MTKATIEAHDPRNCTVEVSPSEVDAGGEVSVTIFAACPQGCDLSGHIVSVLDATGEEVASAELTQDDEGESWWSQISFTAPAQIGRHNYAAVLPELKADGCLHEEVATEFSVQVKAHTVYLNVWGIPSAIPAGEKFAVKMGMKCSSSCCLAGHELEVVGADGETVGTAALGAEIWPGTKALHYAQFESDAPAEPGDWKWSVRVPVTGGEMPHAGAAADFTIRVVPPPEHIVTVEAIDNASKRPLKGMHIWMHPYRGVTDENGIARLKVAKGTYKLHVSGFNYIAHQSIVKAAEDVTARVELIVQPVDEEANWH